MQYALEWYHKTGIYKEDRNMNKNEAAALIRQKIKDAEKNYEVALANRSFDDCSNVGRISIETIKEFIENFIHRSGYGVFNSK